MNLQLQQFLYSSVKMLTMIDGLVVVDPSGEPIVNALVPQGNLIESVEHLATGQYRFHLKENLYAGVASLATPFSAPGDISSGITVEISGSSDISSSSDPQVTFNCFDSSGVLADPAPYSGFNVLMFGRNSSVKY